MQSGGKCIWPTLSGHSDHSQHTGTCRLGCQLVAESVYLEFESAGTIFGLLANEVCKIAQLVDA